MTSLPSSVDRAFFFIIGFVLFFGLMPSVSGVFPLVVSSSLALAVICLISMYASALSTPGVNWPIGLVISAVIFVISVVVGILSTTDQMQASLVSLKSVVFGCLLIVLYPWISRMPQRDRMKLSFFLGLGLCISSGYAMYDQETILYFVEYDPNYLAIALLANLVTCKAFGHRSLFIVLSLLLVLTFSRMAFLAYAILFFRIRFAFVMPIIVFFSIIVFLFTTTEVFGNVQLPEKLEMILNASSSGEVLSELLRSSRLSYWSEGFAVLNEKPLGVGVGASPHLIGVTGFTADVEFSSGARGNTAHNMFITVVVEYGFITGFFFLSSLLLIFSFFLGFHARVFPVVLLFMILLDVHLQAVIYYFCACCLLARTSDDEEGVRF